MMRTMVCNAPYLTHTLEFLSRSMQQCSNHLKCF
jgi:hypothetical protein